MRPARSRASEASRGGAPAQDDSGIGNVNQLRAPRFRARPAIPRVPQCARPAMRASRNARVPQCARPAMRASRNARVPQCARPAMRASRNPARPAIPTRSAGRRPGRSCDACFAGKSVAIVQMVSAASVDGCRSPSRSR